MRKFRNTAILCTSALASLLTFGCGGGGGGGNERSNETGDLSLNLEKDLLDSGDFSRVRVELYDINSGGVLLKFHYPRSLKYSKNSAILIPSGEDEIRIDPFTEATAEQDRYLVFFLSPEKALGNTNMVVEFDIKASAEDLNAFIEVDLDNNDPNTPDGQEFSESSPQFTALDRREIEIRRDDALPTPTPAVTATPAK